VGTPELPGVSSPSVDLDGAVKVSLRVARGATSAALSPVHLNKIIDTVLICQSPTSVDALVL
jgi:hypothetical protein